MKRGLKKGTSSAAAASRAHPTDPADNNQDIVRLLSGEISSINDYFKDLRYFWAKAIGVSGPQWMILMALADLDRGEGVPVNVVSEKLHVDPSFVTTQSKMLEKKGFMRQRTSVEDARTVRMSLTDKSYKHIADLAAQQDALNELVLAEFNERELTDFTGKLTSLRNRLEKADLKVTIGI